MSRFDSRTVLKKMVRDHHKTLLNQLNNQFNNLSLCEDALQESLFKALTHWQKIIPDNPQAWLYKTAKNAAIDSLRKQKTQQDKTLLVSFHFDQMLNADGHEHDDFFLIPDQELKLIFTCCHPALSFDNQVALTLQVICGLSAEQIATTFIKSKKATEQRLVRAKKKIKLAGIPYQVPDKAQLSERLDAVLKIIYLIFNQGYYSERNDQLIQERLVRQAIRLGQLIVDLIPDHAEAIGLLSLMYFHKARMAARSGNLFIDLATQNRSLWHTEEITFANQLFEQAMTLKSLGTFQLQAAISGVHTMAQSFEDTDWTQISLLYEKLLSYQNDAIVNINQAVALSYCGQASKALNILTQLESQQNIRQYLPYFVAKAHVHETLGQTSKAKANYDLAIAQSKHPSERQYLDQKRCAIKKGLL